MKRSIEITASFTGKISTGQFENAQPFYAIKECLEDVQISDVAIKNRQEELQYICYEQFKRHAEAAYAERIAKQFSNIRFYDGKDGLKYPSVTSIINWDSDYRISQEELQQYASRGTIIDKQVEVYLKTGEWKEPTQIPEIYPDVVILKGGSLGLVVDDVDFREFYKQYPFKVLELQTTMINHDKRYGGRIDIKCVIESTNKGKWEKIEGVIYDEPTILDIKTGAIDKTKMLKQQTAYWWCDDTVKQVGLIHLNKEVKQGFSQPIIETSKEKYWHLFLKDRSNFKQRFGI